MDTSWLVAGINQLIEGAWPPRSHKQAALAEINNFRKRTTTSPWKLDRELVALRLETLVGDARKVRQGALGTCGPAAFLRSWIPEDPLAFVKFAGELYDTGKGKLGTMDIEPDDDLVEQDYAKNVHEAIKKKYGDAFRMFCPSADWMVMCSMIDDANIGLDYQGTPEEDWSHGSVPSQMNAWFEAVAHNVDSWDVSAGNTDFIYQLSPVPMKRHIVLVIHTYLLNKTAEGVRDWIRWALDFPNHFVVLDTPVSKGFDGKVRFEAWTWGETPTTTYELTEEDILDYTDEVISAEH
jgi:hypothetical protein